MILAKEDHNRPSLSYLNLKAYNPELILILMGMQKVLQELEMLIVWEDLKLFKVDKEPDKRIMINSKNKIMLLKITMMMYNRDRKSVV